MLKVSELKSALKKYPGLYKFLQRGYYLILYLIPVIRYGFLILPKYKYRYNLSGVVTRKNVDFLDESEFQSARQSGQSQDLKCDLGWDGFILHSVLWAASQAIKLDGDFVECGVFRGRAVKSVVDYVNFKNFSNKNYFLFDTFCGFCEKYSEAANVEQYKDVYFEDVSEFVRSSFKEFPNVHLVKGAIPDTLNDVKIERVAYLYIDMNTPIPEKAALEFFWPKIVQGGVVILDDYGWGGIHDIQKVVHDEFAKSKGVKILTLPTGQGLIIK